MDIVLEKVFPYEGIPEIILCFLCPIEKHKKGSNKLREFLERKYKTVDEDGDTYFYNELHSFNDQPSVILSKTKTKVWHQYGKVHREGDNPAVIMYGMLSGQSCWYQDGVLHREAGPARISATKQEWFCKGKLVL